MTTHGVARIREALEHLPELPHVLEVKAGGGLVQDVDRLAGLSGAAARVASFTRCASPPESVVARLPEA